MARRPALVASFLWLLGACGGGSASDAPAIDAAAPDAAPPDATPACVGTFRECLDAADGIEFVEERDDNNGLGAYLHVGFRQQVDHDDASAGTFTQIVNILYVDRDAPTVLLTSGYYEMYHAYRDELSTVLGANQVALEHRFFGESVPNAADWSTLTVRQAAADQHELVRLLRPILNGAWVSTGTSKGGMTAAFHRRFYPDDVVGTVPVSAPMSHAYPDDRYDAHLETIGSPACHAQAIAAVQAMLGTYGADFVARTTQLAIDYGYTFGTYTAAQSLQDAVKWLYWGTFQSGRNCDGMPGAGASANVLWDYLTTYSNPLYFVEEGHAVGNGLDAYMWQARAELGMQEFALDALAPLVVDPVPASLSNEWGAALPGVLPTFDGSTLDEVETWLDLEGDGFVFLYGTWDPWAGAPYAVGGATDTATYWVENGAHNFQFAQMSFADRTAFFATLARWTGVTPQLGGFAAAKRTRDHVAAELARLMRPGAHRRGGPAMP